MDHHEAIAGDNRGGMAASPGHFPHHLRSGGWQGLEKMGLLGMQVMAWTQEARPVFGHGLLGQGLRLCVKGKAVEGLGRRDRK